MYICTYVHRHKHVKTSMWSSKQNFRESVVSLYYEGFTLNSGLQAWWQIFYLLRHLTNLIFTFS